MIRQALTDAARRLAAVTDTARLDAELLMAHALGVTRNDLLLRHLDDSVPDSFEALLQRRLNHEPVAYITGTRAFWTIDLRVGPGVLIPRPDSETLIEAAIAHFGGRAPATILDLGTGPGTLLLAALDQWPEARGLGVDASEPALAYARANADRLGMAARAAFRIGDWTQRIEGRFDLILANPPYIGTAEPLPAEVRDHEPAAALFAGPDGLDDYRRIVPALPQLLAEGGAAVLEIGWTQADAVAALGRDCGLSPAIHRDLGGRPRVVLLT
ncbi:release factor glutamine methyltransferase [Sphingomonas naasensis]|uniref:Release factor glutamine methyltransferase n=1 Tax=Sphingomonas naasensis TaxID=1344951 RepID=A0A4S1WCH3_9SPHN|nr:peptide chain release factor N(5)-glutamine methyltransferase [Sphingomonas naasensis]NIJ22452.1 release factor glutamine methyltransferase [Sphingomonas naasensis]TGX40569.1 peptide chain release factor N(5)-glutamine methyltransferase [Sphingomonas naasensis]